MMSILGVLRQNVGEVGWGHRPPMSGNGKVVSENL